MIQLNYRDARPIYEQVKDGLRHLVVTGALQAGDKLPSVRALASSLAINPNTIQRAYESLEREGYVEKLADETDQRRKAVRLTPKGEAAIQRCVQVFEAVDQSMFEGFRPEEARQACGYLMRMLHNLRGDLPPERMNCQC